jgi:hypothetical protein
MIVHVTPMSTGKTQKSKFVSFVPRKGASKGCNTCRRRKKGVRCCAQERGEADQRQCDLRRPFCIRCLSDGHTCEGYERAATFVQHKPAGSEGNVRLKQSRTKSDYRSQATQLHSGGVVLHPSLASSAFGEQCASFWWESYIPKEDSRARRSTGISQQSWTSDWTDAIARMSTTSAVLRKALYALSLSCASCQKHDEKLVRQGLQYYSEALVELARSLSNPDYVIEDGSLLPTCLLLADFEVSVAVKRNATLLSEI